MKPTEIEQIEKQLGRELNADESLVALALLYLKQNQKLLGVCQLLVDWSLASGNINHLKEVVIPQATEALESIEEQSSKASPGVAGLLEDLYQFLAEISLGLLSPVEQRSSLDRWGEILEVAIWENGGKLPPQG